MKKLWALMLVSLMSVFALTGCGTDKNNGTNKPNSGSTVTDDNTAGGSAAGSEDAAIDDTDDSLTGEDDSAIPNEENGAASGSAVTGNGTAGTNGQTAAGSTVTKQNTLLKPATYGQMLRNAHVHDRDGDLSDHENSLTPGITY